MLFQGGLFQFLVGLNAFSRALISASCRAFLDRLFTIFDVKLNVHCFFSLCIISLCADALTFVESFHQAIYHPSVDELKL